jgi:hypothetical protein
MRLVLETQRYHMAHLIVDDYYHPYETGVSCLSHPEIRFDCVDSHFALGFVEADKKSCELLLMEPETNQHSGISTLLGRPIFGFARWEI